MRIYHGMSLRQAMKACRRLGGEVRDVKSTGEVDFTHPESKPCRRINMRKKDAPRAAVKWLLALQENKA